MRALRHRYGRARKVDAPWGVGDVVQTIGKIPGDPPIYPPVAVRVEEVKTYRPTRHKDRFGQWVTTRPDPRIRVAYNDRSFWVYGDILERP